MEITKKIIFKDENNILIDKHVLLFSPKEWPEVYFEVKYKNKNKPVIIKQRCVVSDIEESGLFLFSYDIDGASIFRKDSKLIKKYESIVVLKKDNIQEEYTKETISFVPKQIYKKLIISVEINNNFYKEVFEIQDDCLVSLSKRLRFKEFSIPTKNFIKAEYI